MWTWERERRRQAEEPAIQPGMVTLVGEETAVNLGGERRWLGVCAPGGVSWKPRQGQRVLVLKTGEDACVIGTMEEDNGLEPGELQLSGGSCTVRLGRELTLSGEIVVNGQPLEDLIRAVVAEELSGG